MQWIILFLGNVLGAVISAFSRKNRDSFALRALSIIVPVSFSALFWYVRFKSGDAMNMLGSLTNLNSVTNTVVNVAVTSVVFAVLSKGFGLLIAKYIELR